MKRRIAIIMLLLAGGAIVNIAVAWGFTWRMWPPRGEVVDTTRNVRLDTFRGLPTTDLDQLRPTRFGWTPRNPRSPHEFVITRFVQSSFACRRTTYAEQAHRIPDSYIFTTGPGPHSAHIVDIVHAGFPLSTLVGEAWSDYMQPPIPTQFFYGDSASRQPIILRGAIGFDRAAQLWMGTYTVQQIYPARPIFLGFLINTVFYAVLLWLLFLAMFAARRMIRRSRGLCETCAYPIGVSPVCTECGAAVQLS